MDPERFTHSILYHTHQLFSDKPFKTTVKTFWGEPMDVVFPEVVSVGISYCGYNDVGLTHMILDYLKSGMTFLDVGAHFGFYTLLASRMVGDGGHVHSFEPTPSSFEILESNVKDHSNVVALNLALYSHTGKLSFKDYGITYSAFNSHYYPRVLYNPPPPVTEYEVQAVRLDEYLCEKAIRPDFIKIDAESSEYDILKGGCDTIEEHRPIITLETGDLDYGEASKSGQSIKYLLDRGYGAYEYYDGRIIEHQLLDHYAYDNLLFLPE
ncbi:MAG: FkbM family methyltransferase [Candidatus Altiarchaeota archaeon]